MDEKPVDLQKYWAALNRIIHGQHTLHVPPLEDDEDVLLAHALRELKHVRAELQQAREQLATLDCDNCNERAETAQRVLADLKAHGGDDNEGPNIT